MRGWIVAASVAAVGLGCGSGDGGAAIAPPTGDAGGITFVPDDDAAGVAHDGSPATPDAGEGGAAVEAGDDAPPVESDGGIPADRFVTKVVSFQPGDCAGYGGPSMPGIVEGPPVGEGASQGSTDVVSLGNGGTIVVSFEPNAIVDGPGADFLVFENAFYVGGDPSHVYAEPGEVSVSDDGVTWKTFPCTATAASTTPAEFGQCAGWHPVYSSPADGISPVDPSVAGGDPFDLADVGLTHARYVRVVDESGEACTPPNRGNSNGFDLDAVSLVHAEIP